MPPRKNPSKDTAGSSISNAGAAGAETPGEGIDAYELPRALVTRIAKSAVRDLSSYQFDGC
jgi:hypothetical protein